MDSTRTASKPAPSPAAVLGSTLLVVAAAATVAFFGQYLRGDPNAAARLATVGNQPTCTLQQG